MSKNREKLQKALAADDFAIEILSQKDRKLLTRFDEELDRLRKEEGIPDSCSEPDEVINEAFRLVPGAKRVLGRKTKGLDNIMKTGSG